MKILIIAGVVCLSASALAQTSRFPPINLYTGDPTGNTCSGNLIQQSSTTGLLYTCQSGAMKVQGNPANAIINPGSGYKLPAYPATSGSTVNPINITTDATGNNLNVPANVASQSVSATSIVANTSTSSVNNVINIMAPPYSAACNLTQYSNGTISAAGTTLTGSGFTSALVGQKVIVWNAGAVAANGSYAPLQTTVASYTDTTHVVLSAAATTAVTAGPFEIGTDDTTAFQSAVNAAALASSSVLVPATGGGKSCLVGAIDLSAGSTVNNPVPVQGQGSYVSYVSGLPGQDVFAWPDGRKVQSGYTFFRGLTVNVDTSIDASSATGGIGTFPNRITGRCANGSGGLTACSPAIAPGAVNFTNGQIIDSGGSNFNELAVQLNVGGSFNSNPSWMFVGMPVNIPSLGITATISQVISGTQILFTPAYTGTATGLAGNYGTPLTPQWNVGNTGYAVPASVGGSTTTNGSLSGGVQMMMDDVHFLSLPATLAFANHSAAMFFQQPPYWARFSRITSQNLFYGYIEALPTSNNQFTWTPDTAHYYDINISATIPLVMYAGNHRILHGVDLYGANHALGLGPFFLPGPANTAGDTTVTQFYHECWSFNSGENQRWSGALFGVLAAALTQCNGPYVQWLADQSWLTSVQIGGPAVPTAATAGLQISGKNNNFVASLYGGTAVNASLQVNDTGTGNMVVDTLNGKTQYAANIPHLPSGILDGSFGKGNMTTPYVSLSALFTRYDDWNLAGAPTGGANTRVAATANDGNMVGSVLHSTMTGGFQQILFNGDPMSVGYRIPATTVNFILYGKVGTAGTQAFTIRDSTTSTLLQTCNFSMTTSYAYHGQAGAADACTVNLTSVAIGDVIYLQYNPSGAVGPYDFQWMFFLPQPSEPSILASGTTATTQSVGDNTTKVTTDAFVQAQLAAAIALATGSTAVTQTAGDNTTKVATDAFVTTAVSGAAGAVCTDWATPGVKTAGQGLLNAANQTTVWSFVLPCSITFTKISYTPSTADNTANTYDIGIYNANGSTLLCHIGATAGTTFAPSTSTIPATVSSCTLAAGTRYIFAFTGTAVTAVLNGTGNQMLGVSRSNVTTATTAGALNSTLTIPVDNWASVNGFPMFSLHN